jgi:cyclophilin family peptidyl-prolyl cis-trans isomerase
MRFSAKKLAIGLALLALFASGCGNRGESDSSNTAAIKGEDSGQASSNSQTAAATGKNAQVDRLHPKVIFETTKGNFIVQLDAEKAPATVENFLAYVDSRFYDGTVFHQVFKNQGILGGGYTPEMTEKTPTRPPVRNEAHNGLKNRRGTIAMVRMSERIDSAQSQFFFNLTDNAMLDHRDTTQEGYGYCVFGQVISGMEVLDAIGNLPVEDTPQFDRKPVEPVIIKSVRRVR